MNVENKTYQCRVCHSDTAVILTFHRVPRSVQRLLQPDQITLDRAIRLNVCKCSRCGLVQFAENIEIPYSTDYLWSVNFSPQAQAYQRDLAERWQREHKLASKAVLEIGGGDGFFSLLLQQLGCQVTMIDPSPEACLRARERGVERVIEGYFTSNTFPDMHFDAVIARHVLEHVARPIDFLRLIHTRLKREGKLFIEVPNFDTIRNRQRFQDLYAEHLSYFDPRSLTYAFDTAGFTVIELYTIEKGDYLVCIAQAEHKELNDVDTALDTLVSQLRTMILEVRHSNRQIAVWGAGGRGVSLLALAEADNLGIEYVVDSDPNKWGKFTPVTHLPVVPPEVLHAKPVDALIILACSFQEEILNQLAWFHKAGGRIGVLHPEPHWLNERLKDES